ncbi:MAG: isochorismatase family protein [Deltaproteobacteria bacterium]|nr:isochorismatase family protein [Deltaproteobacteria bacterium]MBN2671085.1 isochorismatase family protein [Deltaproteobacteria bacterium]
MNRTDEVLGTTIQSAHSALVVVDVQQKLLPHMHDAEKVERRVIQAVEVAGHLNLPIFVTEQYVKGLGPTVSKVKEALARFDAYTPIEKMSFSCFHEPAFVAALESKEIDTLLLCGIESHICVLQTALSALDNEFDVYLIGEAAGSRSKAHKKEALQRLRQEGAVVGSVEMFAFEILQTATHPAFKAVQKVIL